ncbi:MAG: hypothetical protein KGV44_12420 [Flavobacteriaceae bacterium]|nr:hypothetical protein [Flavobacteriaceae bacterium]MBS9768323.1 hypothetical protein [Flavobacteriaceae bacterium]
MSVDFVKIWVKDANKKHLLSLPCLDFKGEYSHSTGETRTTLKAEHHFCEITINKAGVFFSGSIHKLWNSLNGVKAPNCIPEKYKGFNGNQFGYLDIVEVRNYLTKLFDCEPQQMYFQNMEIGVNTTPPFDPKEYLNGLLAHKGKAFDVMANGNYKQAIHQRYYLKIYNKSKQYGMPEHTLRVELKIYKALILHRLGIYTFADVTPETLKEGEKMLIREFNHSLHYDHTIRTDELTERQKMMLLKYSTPNYWLNEVAPQNQTRPKKRLQEITLKYSDNLHRKIEEEIRAKSELNNPISSVIINRVKNDENKISSVTIDRPQKIGSSIIINSSNIGLNIMLGVSKKAPQKCSITGLDISMQKEGSFYLSHTGLKWYLKNDKKEYEKVARKYLSERWANSSLEKQIKELAHNIRTASRDRRLRQEKKYTSEQYRMFDIGSLCKVV